MLNYILQVVLFQLLFLVIYEAFLKKETFFQWNRFYLIFSALLSYVIPLIRIKFFEKYIPEKLNNINTLITDFTEIPVVETKIIKNNTNYFTLENLFFTGIIIMTVLFVYKLLKLFKTIKNNKVLIKKEYKLVLIPNEKNAFSFFKYIFLGTKIYNKEHQHVLQHELVHVTEKHSLDLLFFELQKIIFWFNPIVYFYQYKISVLHEYIADVKTIKHTKKQIFFENLLLQTFQVENLPFVNQYFKKSLLKKRIIMATKNKSKQILKIKYLLVIPVITAMFIIASCNNNEDIIEQEIMAFSSIKKAPVFPGCEDNTTNKSLKSCFNQKINKHIAENFNTSLAKELNLSTGRKKISVQFIIDKNGDVTNIKCRAPHPKLKEETIRIIKKLPKMQAGESENNKKVSVRYYLPIVFNVEGENETNKKREISPTPPAPEKPNKNISLVGSIGNEFGYILVQPQFLKNKIYAYDIQNKIQYPINSFKLITNSKSYTIKGNTIPNRIITNLDFKTRLQIKDIKTDFKKDIKVYPINIKINKQVTI